jgi:DMSO/TMAO reductase YedYZ molybdopterin-dependent catalytic subunit
MIARVDEEAAEARRRQRREEIRPPKFADKFALLDFDARPMPVISMFEPPEQLDLYQYPITVRGDDLRSRTTTWDRLWHLLPVRTLEAPLVCQIFNWHEDVRWHGVRLSDFLDATGITTTDDGYFVFHSRDGHYFETLSHDEARDPRALIAIGMNGAPLPHQYGGPVRLVVPFLQGYKSVKWLNAVHAYPRDPVGIKRMLGQSKTGRLGQAWLDRLGIVPAAGRPGDPAADESRTK